MVGMLNKNFPAYMGFYLRDNDFPEEFIKNLLKRLCCQTALKEADGCKWDSKTRTLTSKEDLASDKNDLDLRQASWYRDTFAELEIDPKRKKKLAPPPESLFNRFDLDGARSMGTIHERHMLQATAGSTPPSQYGNCEPGLRANTSLLLDSDEDSASSPSSVRLRYKHSDGANKTPTSSAEAEDDVGATAGE
jgi:hypothetical protein